VAHLGTTGAHVIGDGGRVIFKLIITAFATIVLLIYMETFRQMAAVARGRCIEQALVAVAPVCCRPLGLASAGRLSSRPV